MEIRSIQCILLANCAPGACSSARMYVYIYILYKNHISTFIFSYQYLLIAFLVRPCQAKAGSSLWETQHFSSVFPGSPRCPCNFFTCFHAFSCNFHTRLVTCFNFSVPNLTFSGNLSQLWAKSCQVRPQALSKAAAAPVRRRKKRRKKVKRKARSQQGVSNESQSWHRDFS